ncbi:CPBP family intramembrane glutamic endopeptidase [Bacillus massilinigeriensis]|uniref:CPBP family intramembrane glutamic endopeptidase n=1 Tax=Bacillus massilionigeriensis TaxID=1805475 RepID=UPI00096B6233|nr:CPBP family intramembrane glutamic endopeptidase [Bacillus massilionigeriensis]
MKRCALDLRLIVGLLMAHLLILLTFQTTVVFWYLFTASMLFLISYSTFRDELDKEAPFFYALIIGLISGVILFAVFWVGNALIHWLHLPLQSQIETLYDTYSPKVAWHYIVLVLIIIPGEEIFWRGFVQRRLSKYLNFPTTVILSVLLYTSVQFYSGTLILPLAAMISGILWSMLYTWKKSVPLVIVSHLIFDLLLFILFPFY